MLIAQACGTTASDTARLSANRENLDVMLPPCLGASSSLAVCQITSRWAVKRKGRKRRFRPYQFLPELGRSSAVTFFYGLVDIVLWISSHEISGHIAMQHLQFNFVWHGTNGLA